jgi:hypothetical protein
MATSEDYLICHEKFVEFAAELAACKSAPPPTVSENMDAPYPRWLRLPSRGDSAYPLAAGPPRT